MRTIPSFLFTALLAVAGFAQAATLKVTVHGPLTSANAQAGAQALRALPDTADVFASTQYHAYALELKAGSQIVDNDLTTSLAQVGQSVTRIEHSKASFATLKTRLQRSKYRYFKWN